MIGECQPPKPQTSPKRCQAPAKVEIPVTCTNHNNSFVQKSLPVNFTQLVKIELEGLAIEAARRAAFIFAHATVASSAEYRRNLVKIFIPENLQIKSLESIFCSQTPSATASF
jgi:hypothetical protein